MATILINLDTDPETLRDIVGVLESILPFMADNVSIDAFKAGGIMSDKPTDDTTPEAICPICGATASEEHDPREHDDAMGYGDL